MHETETGAWAGNRSNGGAIHDERDFSINLNRPLPWVCVAFIVSIFCVFESTKATDASNAAKQAAFDAQTQSLLLRDYVDKLRIEMASHGIKPPDYPQELKHVDSHNP